MAIPRPKILTEITVATGGWLWEVDISDVAQYDTTVQATIPAGTYFLASDNRSDDLCYQMSKLMTDAIQAEGGNFAAATCYVTIHPTTHKVQIQFYGINDATNDNDVRIDWPSSAGDLADAIGFNDNSQDTSTATDNPTFTADFHHAYGWYSDEDGQLVDIMEEDTNVITAVQGTTLSGKVKTQFFGDKYINSMELQFLERYHDSRTKVFSNGVSYAGTPSYPYNRNEPLECWWREARQGKRFRVYRDGYRNTSLAAGRGTPTAGAPTTLTDGGASWETEPQRWDNMLLYTDGIYGSTSNISQGYFINNNTATVLTVPLSPTGVNLDTVITTYYILEHLYETYVLDVDAMNKFEPKQVHKALDRYNITIPLKRYVS